MANLVRVRVEANSKDDSDGAFKRLFTAFKNACKDAGIQHAYKQHQTYESKSRKKRRKQRESEIAGIKNTLRENFQQQQGKKNNEQKN
jgi:ribosomal protein S21